MTLTYQVLAVSEYTGKPINAIKRSDESFIPFAPGNTDYNQFKIDLANGAELHDANNNVMTSDQVTTLLATLP
jgi:hypothetical protein